jgi:hypothetical protein
VDAEWEREPTEPTLISMGRRATVTWHLTTESGALMPRVDDLILRIRVLEDEVQVEYERRRAAFGIVVEEKRVRFSEELSAMQRTARVGLWRYVSRASILSWIVAPVIYAGIVPLVLLDLFLFVYQQTCMRVYRIARVKRSDYLALDRGDLTYLNVLERFNCQYCGYANGLVAYAREITARTEQFFCPIKHARRVLAAHDHYPLFFDYGDAESYRLGLTRLREALAEIGDGDDSDDAGQAGR